jgi:hypothetical protein
MVAGIAAGMGMRIVAVGEVGVWVEGKIIEERSGTGARRGAGIGAKEALTLPVSIVAESLVKAAFSTGDSAFSASHAETKEDSGGGAAGVAVTAEEAAHSGAGGAAEEAAYSGAEGAAAAKGGATAWQQQQKEEQQQKQERPERDTMHSSYNVSHL